jgi:hypothetical protein
VDTFHIVLVALAVICAGLYWALSAAARHSRRKNEELRQRFRTADRSNYETLAQQGRIKEAREFFYFGSLMPIQNKLTRVLIYGTLALCVPAIAFLGFIVYVALMQ